MKYTKHGNVVPAYVNFFPLCELKRTGLLAVYKRT